MNSAAIVSFSCMYKSLRLLAVCCTEPDGIPLSAFQENANAQVRALSKKELFKVLSILAA